ncbi:aminopeptidase N-like [Glandiceps talaboti]
MSSEKYVFKSTEKFEIEPESSRSSSASGCYVSKGTGFAICVLFAVILTGAILITYFVPKCEEIQIPTVVVPTGPPMPVPEEVEDVPKDPFEGRLPDTLTPSLYKVTVKPYLDAEDDDKQFSFDGSVEATFSAGETTNVIVLHAHETLEVVESGISVVDKSSDIIEISEIERVKEYEFLKIHLSGNGLSKGQEYKVIVESFTGTLHHADFQGLYLSNYTEGENNELRHLAATQFETTNTRRAFPCFDEPDLKALFDVTIIHRNTRVALCNMPVESTTAEGDWNTTVFQRTAVVMPTYLVAMVVADFYSVEMTTPNDVQFRVWSRQEALHTLDYSLHTGSDMLTFFENYWDIPYPLPKQDMVAVPDFYFGAMENWGLVIYRETRLMYDSSVNTQYRKHGVAAIIAHELAHMWFGNLVTLAWWDHVWLNEGYASFYEYPALEDAEPTWDAFNQFHMRDDLYRALDYDDSWSSHPAVRPVGWPDDIWDQFDAVAYQRGSCLNMMMRTFLGEDTFKTGITNYLNKYKYSNAETHDLFEELTEADKGKKGTDVKKMMDPWTLQMGHPIVTLTRDGNKIHAEQERFIMDPNEKSNDKYFDMGYLWYVPLTFTDQNEMELDNPKEQWMDMGPADFSLTSSATSNDWYLVNIDYNGLYRVKYESDNWDKLATYLKEQDHTTIPVRTRAQLLEDSFSIANAHQLDQIHSMKMLEYLTKEKEYLPMYTAIRGLGYASTMLKMTVAYGYLEDGLDRV